MPLTPGFVAKLHKPVPCTLACRGHSTPAFTLHVYSHVLPGVQKEPQLVLGDCKPCRLGSRHLAEEVNKYWIEDAAEESADKITTMLLSYPTPPVRLTWCGAPHELCCGSP